MDHDPAAPQPPTWWSLTDDHGVLELDELPCGTALELHMKRLGGVLLCEWCDDRGRTLRVVRGELLAGRGQDPHPTPLVARRVQVRRERRGR